MEEEEIVEEAALTVSQFLQEIQRGQTMSVSTEDVKKRVAEMRASLEASIPAKPELNQSKEWIGLVIKHIPDKLITAFVRSMSSKILDLRVHNLTNADVADYIIHFLDLNPQIFCLNVSYNRIDALGVQLLAANKTLTELNISGNPIGDAGAECLSKNETIKILSAENTLITKRGAAALAKNKTIERLGLATNSISTSGGIALSTNIHLKVLDLCRNDIISVQALARNETLKVLNVWDNGLNALSMTLLYQMNNYRKDKYKAEKWAFLSCMTAIDEKDIIRKTSDPKTLAENYRQAYTRARMIGSNQEKRENSLLFKYRNHPYHRVCDNVLKEVFSFLKPVKIKINGCHGAGHALRTP